MGSVTDRLAHAWNALMDRQLPDDQPGAFSMMGSTMSSYGTRPDRVRGRVSNERSIIASIYNRLSVDFSAYELNHIQRDDQGRFKAVVNSDLNSCFTMKSNVDQGARAFKQDLALSLFEEGDIAVVPIDTTYNPNDTEAYDVQTMRIGKIVKWYPHHVKVNVYNDRTGRREELVMDKDVAVVVPNPFFTTMNEPNSTLQRLIRKLNQLDHIDEVSSSGRLDIIVQLPYGIKTETMREKAEQRRKEMEFQLKGAQHGVAYMDGTEKITQLNRPVENNLLKQVEMLMAKLYEELGLTPEVMNGTADEAAMTNYYTRTIEPIWDAVVQPMRANFLTKTARTQGKTIHYYRDLFKFVTIENFAVAADKLSRNEILSSNELRGILGFKPSDDPKADKLLNSNMPAPPGQVSSEDPPSDPNLDQDNQEG